MSENSSPAKSGVQLGILFGAIMILQFVISYIIGIEALAQGSFGLIINFLNYLIIPVIFIYLGCNNYKNKINHGFITFGESLKIGVSITFLAAFIYSVFTIIFGFIFPEFADEVLEFTKSEMLKKNPNMTSEQLEMSMSMVQKFSKPYIYLPFVIVMYSFIGLIYSLIIGAIVKKEKPQSF